MQLQREDLIAETEQYDTNTMQSQCEDLIALQNNTVQCNCNVEILLQGQNNVKIYIELKSEHH